MVPVGQHQIVCVMTIELQSGALSQPQSAVRQEASDPGAGAAVAEIGAGSAAFFFS